MSRLNTNASGDRAARTAFGPKPKVREAPKESEPGQTRLLRSGLQRTSKLSPDLAERFNISDEKAVIIINRWEKYTRDVSWYFINRVGDAEPGKAKEATWREILTGQNNKEMLATIKEGAEIIMDFVRKTAGENSSICQEVLRQTKLLKECQGNLADALFDAQMREVQEKTGTAFAETLNAVLNARELVLRYK